MGDAKLPRRVWKKPKRPLNYDLKMEELKTLGTFGLKTKRELWKAHTELSRIRNQARSLLALGQDVRQEKEPILIRSLSRIGLVDAGSTLDDVLNLKVTDLLARRLQTIVMRNIGFKTPYQARQAIVHGHITIDRGVVTIPSYTVDVEEEKNVRLAPGSKLEALLVKLKEDAAKGSSDAEQTASDQTREQTIPEQTTPPITPEQTAPSTTPEQSTPEQTTPPAAPEQAAPQPTPSG